MAVDDRVGNVLLDQIVDPVIDRHLSTIYSKYSAAWEWPYQFRAPSHVGRAVGNAVDDPFRPADW